ncbi:hypothetical protein CIL05_00420 [Virgibacillus profundi]|uniref:Uncharacterized protein n=1 Tax=Virgibacillus profundi TaxID=2024555 RepID=A0A2A2IHA7_9BACI|nr:hypothetical protein CIL05_00420 [Virgibacillus profundi]PXY55342.1 hypothetical protein CIT14_00420 [Virgibacillus profundi]
MLDVSQLYSTFSQLLTSFSQLHSAMSQLLADFSQLHQDEILFWQLGKYKILPYCISASYEHLPKILANAKFSKIKLLLITL